GAVQPGGSARLRIAETYTDAKGYRLEGEELVFDRTFGRPRNSVVLPAGWYLTASSIPALVSETSDGRIRLDFVNPRNDEIAVLIKARRRGRTRTDRGHGNLSVIVRVGPCLSVFPLPLCYDPPPWTTPVSAGPASRSPASAWGA